jgi:hypothetical protein
MAVKPHDLANRPGKPYPATFRLSVDRPGNRTPISWLQARHLPVGRAAHVFIQRSVRELNPAFRLTKAVCSRSTYRPSSFVAVTPDGIEPSLSWMWPRRLCPWTTGSGCQ